MPPRTHAAIRQYRVRCVESNASPTRVYKREAVEVRAMLGVLSAAVAVCATPLGIVLLVINFRLDSLYGPTTRPIPGGGG